jgi:alpha-D-ribose 1-methylphosphonate 5-triphosphate synthase subunit PhnI
MGYTSVTDRTGAVAAAGALADRNPDLGDAGLVADQVMAESGVADRRIAVTALAQAGGDVARAVSLVRAWAAVLPRLATSRVPVTALRALRRITPGFAEPAGGQYLGASLDYEQRLLRLDPARLAPAGSNGHHPEASQPPPKVFPRALDALTREGLIASPEPLAEAVDINRQAVDRRQRGALLQLLARGETGALTALAYTAIRGNSSRQDPTLAELRRGRLQVSMSRPGGGSFRLGEIEVTYAEVVLYRLHGGSPDPRLTLGVGATVGELERRAIAAAVLDANCARAAVDPLRRLEPAEDAEFLAIALDGQEATGFVEHLKLPHHVTFTSELDRIRQAREAAE